ncbi:MAG: biotin--[acetyl-CoA-carboxylase] ligase [Limnohabitans sp.]|nr:biotin--[acetyl-CoA-carboxylase] ligase [Limnohabitans sp.]
MSSFIESLKFLHFKELESTQTYGQNLVNNKLLSTPTLISTDFQKKGKGQNQKNWHASPAKNILQTLVLPIQLPIKHQFIISIITALSCYDFFENYLKPDHKSFLKVKWPNDIYYKNLKIGGILINLKTHNQTIHYAFIGTGLNINQVFSDAAHLNATSLAQINHDVYAIQHASSFWIHCFDSYFTKLTNLNTYPILVQRFNEVLYKKNEPITFTQDCNLKIKVTIKEVKETGILIVEDAQNNLIEVYDSNKLSDW